MSASLARRRELETLVRTDETYWREHDARVLPARFLASLDALAADAEVVHATDIDPGG